MHQSMRYWLQKHVYLSIVTIFIALIVILSVFTQLSFAAPGDSEEEPIKVSNCTDLQLMQDAPRGTYFQLTSDIDCVGEGSYIPIDDFRGQLDGNNKTIRNLMINRPSDYFVGVFADVYGGVIKDVRFEDIAIVGGNYVGVLAGYVASELDEEDEGLTHYSTISNVFVDTAFVTSTVDYAGVGGLVGTIVGTNVSNINIKDISIYSGGIWGWVGGLFGSVSTELGMQNVYVQGGINKPLHSGDIGGVIGHIDAYGGNSISRIVTNMDVSMMVGSGNVGGFIGTFSGGSDAYTDIVVLGSISGGNNVAAVVGYANDYYEEAGYTDTDYCPYVGDGEYLCDMNGVSPTDLQNWGWSCMYDEGDDSYSCEYEVEPYTDFYYPFLGQIYYSTATGQSECVNSLADSQGYDELAIATAYTSKCTEVDVDIDPGYFFDSTNVPFSDDEVWDFTTVWQENDGAPPTLRSSFTEGEEGGENTVPTITVGTPSQRSIMVGAPPYTVVSVTTTIADVDNDMTSLVMQHSLDGDTWVSSTISSVTPSEGGVTTSSGTISGIDTNIDGSVDLTIIWNAGADIVDGTYDETVYLRFTPNDGTVDGSTVTSTAFTIDFVDPTAPGEIDILSVTTSSITIARPNPTSTDPNLVGYAIYMNTTTDVFSGGTPEWGGGQDPNLLNGNWNGATFTTIDSPVGRLSGGLTPNTRYYLQLFAFDMYANAATTTEISTITLAATPTNFVTTTVTTSSISFVWDANGNPEGTVYTVSSTFGPLTTTATSTSISGLVPDTTYIVELFATNGDGVDTDSRFIEVRTDVGNTPPTVVVDILGFGRSMLSVSTTVSDVDLDDASLTIEYSLDGDTWFPISIGFASSTGEGSVTTSSGSIEGIGTSNDGSVAVSFTWLVTSDVAAGTYDETVYLRVIPSDGVLSGEIVVSDPFIIDLVQPTAPGPTIITDITANSFRILRPDPIATDDSPIQYIYYVNTTSPAADGYEYYSVHDLNLGVDDWNGATSTEVTVFGGGFLETALIPNTRYSLQLFVYDRYGNTTTTPEVSLYTHAEKPSSFATSSIATSSISLTWDANGNPDGTLYVVSSSFGIVTTTDTNITLIGLDPSTIYTIEFFARNYDGVDTAYTLLEVTTEHLNYEPVVSEFSVTQESNSNALVTVRAGDFDAMFVPDIDLKYIFSFSTSSGSGPWEYTTFTSIATDVIDGSILIAKPWSVIHVLGTTVGTPENPTTFSFTVNWDISSDLGTYDGPVYLLLEVFDGENEVFATTTASISMTAPSLSVIERSTSTAEITVLPASGIDVAYYELTNLTTDEAVTSTEATFILSGLTPSTQYEFAARTYSSGDVASATSSVSTLVTYAVPPESLTVTDVTHNSMTFYWSDSGATLYRLFDVDDLETPIISTAGLFLSLEGFECETAYEFALYAYNQLDEVSLTSSTTSVTTGACVDEPEPTPRRSGSTFVPILPMVTVSDAIAFMLNQGAAYTTSPTVEAVFTGISNVTHVALSNTQDFSGVNFIPFTQSMRHILTLGEGLKTVYAKLRSADGVIRTLQDTITLTSSETELPQDVSCPLTRDTAVKTANSNTIYYITTSCTKLRVPTPMLYFTYFTSWSTVQTVSQSILNSIIAEPTEFFPYGPLYRPQYGALVKTPTDSKVYLILNDTKYWITDETVFNTLGYEWNWIEGVDPRFLDKYPTGSEITDITRHPNYTIIKYQNSNRVYRLEPNPTNPNQTIKRWIPDEATFMRLNFSWDRILTVADTFVYTDGPDLTN